MKEGHSYSNTSMQVKTNPLQTRLYSVGIQNEEGQEAKSGLRTTTPVLTLLFLLLNFIFLSLNIQKKCTRIRQLILKKGFLK